MRRRSVSIFCSPGPRVPASVFGKNIQDKLRAIDHAAVKHVVDISLLAGRQARIENHQVGFAKLRFGLDFFEFAASDERSRIGPVAKLQHRANHITARAFRQLRQLDESVPLHLSRFSARHARRTLAPHTDEQNALPIVSGLCGFHGKVGARVIT
jgi:hypothetical protein